jgi:hypothetical protein
MPTPPPQVPLPSQTWGVATVPLQAPAPQEVPCGYRAHAPEALQAPVSPHVEAADITHRLPGLVPAAALPQVPSAPPPLPAAVHAWQAPLHALLQQTPPTQKPLVHWLGIEHAVPLPLVLPPLRMRA